MTSAITKYLPILKLKAGELWSLKNLKASSKKQISPIIELVLPKKLSKKERDSGKAQRGVQEQVKRDLKKVEKAWGTEQAFFLDTKWLASDAAFGNAQWIWDECKRLNLQAIPVISIHDSAQYRNALRRNITSVSTQPLLRLNRSDFGNQTEIQNLLNNCNLEISSVHLLLDYKGAQMSLVDDISKIPSLNEWLTLSSASGVFPASLSQYSLNRWHTIDRTCWISWLASKAQKLPRDPVFSDYATRYFGAPPGGGSASVTLRYTTDRSWLVFTGPRFSGRTSGQMIDICRELVNRAEFSGKDFSEGDREIHSRATGVVETTGAPREWASWGVSHHLEFVVSQLSL